MKVAIIGCSKKKTATPGPAGHVYCSRHFRVALAWARSFTDDVFIASTKLGLIRPTTEIAPYDHSFSTSSAAKAPGKYTAAQRAQWGLAVAVEIGKQIPDDAELVFVVGRSYWSEVVPFLPSTRRWSAPFQHQRLATRTASMSSAIGAP